MEPRSATCGRSPGCGQALPGLDPVKVSYHWWAGCAAAALKKREKTPDGLFETVYSFDAPSSTALKSWLVVARGASAPLRLVGHLGWVHRQEARAVGRPRERMMPLREALTPRRDRAGLARKTRSVGPPQRLHTRRLGREDRHRTRRPCHRLHPCRRPGPPPYGPARNNLGGPGPPRRRLEYPEGGAGGGEGPQYDNGPAGEPEGRGRRAPGGAWGQLSGGGERRA